MKEMKMKAIQPSLQQSAKYALLTLLVCGLTLSVLGQQNRPPRPDGQDGGQGRNRDRGGGGGGGGRH